MVRVLFSHVLTFDSHAEKADGSIFQHFANCARDVNAYICYGYLRRTECGGCTICQAVVARESGELVLSYDKMHLCDMGACSEVGYGVQPGSTPGVFEINGVKVGVTICYDIRLPGAVQEARVGCRLRPDTGTFPRLFGTRPFRATISS